MIAAAARAEDMTLGFTGVQRQRLGLEKGVDDADRSRLLLALPAVAVIDEDRRRVDRIARRATSTSTGQPAFPRCHGRRSFAPRHLDPDALYRKP
jgi:hypothetical protein